MASKLIVGLFAALTLGVGVVGYTLVANGAVWSGSILLAATLILALAIAYGPSETLAMAAKALRAFSWWP